jgi:predicted transcriptional regulator
VKKIRLRGPLIDVLSRGVRQKLEANVLELAQDAVDAYADRIRAETEDHVDPEAIEAEVRHILAEGGPP